MAERDWDESYGAVPPPWDVGHPQPKFTALELRGRVIDVGCGTGEHTLLAAAQGADALGIDLSAVANAKAREKAAERGLEARFERMDALELGSLGERFDVALDSGCYHVFDAQTRPRYAGAVAAVLEPGGTLYLQAFSTKTPGDWGPQRISEDELRATFDGGDWSLVSLEPATFDVNAGSVPMTGVVHAWFLVARRV